MRRRVGLVFQYPEHQLFEETVYDDISFVLRQRPAFSPGEIEEKVKKACLSVGLDYEKFRWRSPFELSSGEMRRVALAGVLVQDPKILILDEPTVGLDGEGKKEILREIRELRSRGKDHHRRLSPGGGFSRPDRPADRPGPGKNLRRRRSGRGFFSSPPNKNFFFWFPPSITCWPN